MPHQRVGPASGGDGILFFHLDFRELPSPDNVPLSLITLTENLLDFRSYVIRCHLHIILLNLTAREISRAILPYV